jgi:hypothetical protein
MVQVALPDAPAGDPRCEIRDLLSQAIDAAEEFARRRGIDSLPGLRALVSAL